MRHACAAARARRVLQKGRGTRARVRGEGWHVAGGCVTYTPPFSPPPNLLVLLLPCPLWSPPLPPDVSGTTGAAGRRVLGGRQGKGRKGVWGFALLLIGTGSETIGLAPTDLLPFLEVREASCLWVPEQGLERKNMDIRARDLLVAPLPDHAKGPPSARGPDAQGAADAPAAGLPSWGLLPGNTRPPPRACPQVMSPTPIGDAPDRGQLHPRSPTTGGSSDVSTKTTKRPDEKKPRTDERPPMALVQQFDDLAQGLEEIINEEGEISPLGPSEHPLLARRPGQLPPWAWAQGRSSRISRLAQG